MSAANYHAVWCYHITHNTTITTLFFLQIFKFWNILKWTAFCMVYYSDVPKCPSGATGQYVYRPDCRKFLNCFKGRGFVQFCAPGTLFNPDTLECDFPFKVKCLPLSPDEERWNNMEVKSTGMQRTTSVLTHHHKTGCEGCVLGVHLKKFKSYCMIRKLISFPKGFDKLALLSLL